MEAELGSFLRADLMRIHDAMSRVENKLAIVDTRTAQLCRCSDDLELRMRASEGFRARLKGVLAIFTVGAGAIGAWFAGIKDVLDISINL